MGNNLLGYYSYKNTFIHKVDPRVKLLFVITISILLFFLKFYSSFIIVSSFIISLIVVSKIKLENMLKNFKPFLFFFIFILLMYFLFSKNQFNQGIIVVWRFILLITIAAILTSTTSINQLVYAIEKLFTPLKFIGANSRDIAIMVSATIRFIPLLFFEASKIKDAQKSRGANLKNPKNISGFVNNLLGKTFNKAYNLADAIESRCYRNHSYTHFKELKLCIADYVSAIIVLTFIGVLLWIGN